MSRAGPGFARDPATARYYDRRATEYDDWYRGHGRFAARDRPGWEDEVDALVAWVGELPPARTLDVACGSGFLTRHLRGTVVGLDQSRAMVAVTQGTTPRRDRARRRCPRPAVRRRRLRPGLHRSLLRPSPAR